MLLWDRVVGFDSLEPLPLLAVAILLFRSQSLLHAQHKEQVHRVLAESAELRVVPLLQMVLFAPQQLVSMGA